MKKREIKFRAWLSGKHDNLTFTKKSMAYNIAIGKNGGWLDVEGGWDIHGEYTTVPIMQFTGVRDMLGKEVYESDKVIYTLNNDSGQKEIEAVVEWYNHAWRLNRIWLLTGIRNIKVIGNVHENIA